MADLDPSPETKGQDAKGHRARLRARLLARHGGDALLDHELVEYLLMLAIPRVDTKPIAKALLREFGGLGGLFAADPESLGRVDGMGESGAAAIRIVAAATTRVLRAEVSQRPVLASWQALLDYLRADMAHAPVERVRVLHLNTRNMLIRDELLSEGTIDEAAVHVREVIRRALDLGSASLILVHNHPSGDPAPSRADIDLTRAIVEAGKPLRIAVHDHLIIGTQGHVSLRAKGVI
ncbi:MAG: RadC family protein [Janthinobacterium lividum]